MSEMNTSLEFWIVGVLMSTVAMIGFIGNIICILMFKYKRLNMNQTFTSLLTWVAVIDSVFLVSRYETGHDTDNNGTFKYYVICRIASIIFICLNRGQKACIIMAN